MITKEKHPYRVLFFRDHAFRGRASPGERGECAGWCGRGVMAGIWVGGHRSRAVSGLRGACRLAQSIGIEQVDVVIDRIGSRVRAGLRRGRAHRPPRPRRSSVTGSSGHIRSSARRCSRSSVRKVPAGGLRKDLIQNVLGRLRPGYSSPKPWKTSSTLLPRKNSRSLPHTRATPTITCPSRGAACTGCSESGCHSRPSTTPGGTSFTGPKKLAKSCTEWL
jgi:hypothetical protein